MNGHQQRTNPHSPPPDLYTHNRDGVPSPAGFAFNRIGQLVPLAYQPWMFGPQQAWESFYNPEYLAWGQGDATIEPQPNIDPGLPARWGKDPLGRAVPPLTHEHFAFVPNYEYINREDPEQPTQNNGTLALTGIGAIGAPARIMYRRSKSLISYVLVPSPDVEFALSIQDATQPSPLGVPPTQGGVAEPPIGGCVSIVQASIGHLGNTFDFIYDVPPGQIIHVPFGGSFGQIRTLLVPKYFAPSLVPEPGTGFRQYLLINATGSPTLTQPPGTPGGSSIWNNMTPQVLAQNNFAGLGLPAGAGVGNPNTTPFLAWFGEAEGSFMNIPQTAPVRRFYGTVMCTATVPNPLSVPIVNAEGVTVAPVAYNVKTVTLNSNPGLSFIARGNVPNALFGPYPANTPITIPANTTSIIVFANTNLTQTGVPVIEEYFELDYTLSF
jgi:hypothetical protein